MSSKRTVKACSMYESDPRANPDTADYGRSCVTAVAAAPTLNRNGYKRRVWGGGCTPHLFARSLSAGCEGSSSWSCRANAHGCQMAAPPPPKWPQTIAQVSSAGDYTAAKVREVREVRGTHHPEGDAAADAKVRGGELQQVVQALVQRIDGG
jgi:hypothetical protein